MSTEMTGIIIHGRFVMVNGLKYPLVILIQNGIGMLEVVVGMDSCDLITVPAQIQLTKEM